MGRIQCLRPTTATALTVACGSIACRCSLFGCMCCSQGGVGGPLDLQRQENLVVCVVAKGLSGGAPRTCRGKKTTTPSFFCRFLYRFRLNLIAFWTAVASQALPGAHLGHPWALLGRPWGSQDEKVMKINVRSSRSRVAFGGDF